MDGREESETVYVEIREGKKRILLNMRQVDSKDGRDVKISFAFSLGESAECGSNPKFDVGG